MGDVGAGSRRCTNLVDYISVMPTLALLLALFFAFAAPIFYWRVFLPYRARAFP